MNDNYCEVMIRTMSRLVTRPVVAYNPDLARISGSVNAGMMLSRMCEWGGPSSDSCGDGWFCKTRDEWQEELAMTRSEQETARRKLREAGIIEEDRRGLPARVHFRVNVDKVNDLLSKLN